MTTDNREHLTQEEFEKGVSEGVIKVTLGELIRRRRTDLKISQVELAKRIGVKSHTYISKIERGEQRGSYRILARISMELRLPWSLMMRTGEIEMPQLNDDSVARTFLNTRFDRFHPVVKEELIEIGDILEKYV